MVPLCLVSESWGLAGAVLTGQARGQLHSSLVLKLSDRGCVSQWGDSLVFMYKIPRSYFEKFNLCLFYTFITFSIFKKKCLCVHQLPWGWSKKQHEHARAELGPQRAASPPAPLPSS